MKYFTWKLVAAANDWIKQTPAESLVAGKRYWRTVHRYRRNLDKLQRQLSKPAYRFFRHGFGRYGLHDATLLRFCVGDGLDFHPSSRVQLDTNLAFSEVRLEFLNSEQDLHYRFSCRRVKSIKCDLTTVLCGSGLQLQFLDSYEISGIDNDWLRLGFMFMSGRTIEIVFRKLVFRRKRIRRK